MGFQRVVEPGAEAFARAPDDVEVPLPESYGVRLASMESAIAVVKQAPLNIDHAEYDGYATDDLKAQAAVDDIGANTGKVIIPPGARAWSGTVDITNDDVEVFGYGPNKTLLAIQGDYDHFNVTGDRCAVSDLWIGSFAARASGFGLHVFGTVGQSIETFRGDNLVFQNVHSPFLAEYVGRLEMFRPRWIQSIAGAVDGALFRLLGCIGARIIDPIAFATAGAFGAEGILLDSDCDTIHIRGPEILNCVYAMRLKNSLGGASTGPRLVRVRDACLESSAASGLLIEDGRDVQFDGGHAASNVANGVHVTGGTLLRIAGFLAMVNGEHGYHLNGGLGHTMLDGCRASNNSQATHDTYDGCRVENDQQHVGINGGQYGDSVFALANKQRYGVTIGATGTDYIVVQGVDLSRNQTGDIGNFSGGTHNNVSGNIS